MKRLFIVLTLAMVLILIPIATTSTMDRWPSKNQTILVLDKLPDAEWSMALYDAMEIWNQGLTHLTLLYKKDTRPCGPKQTRGTITVCFGELSPNILGLAERNRKHHSVLITIKDQPTRKQAIACHELGHALGLSHRGTSQSCMVPTINNNDTPDQLDYGRVNKQRKIF